MLSKTIDVDGLKVVAVKAVRLGGALRHRDRLRRSTPKAGFEHVLSDF
jgi:hypothetical protein